MKQVSAIITDKRQLLGSLLRKRGRNILGSWLIWLKCPEIAREAQPGQFVMVCCGEQCVLPRPFSIHQIDSQGNLALFFSVWEEGKGTKWLSERAIGATVSLFGPLGNGFSVQSSAKNLLLVAGGIGIAPLAFLAQEASNKGHSVTLLMGASGESQPSGEPNLSQLYPAELLPTGVQLKTAITDRYGEKGMVGELLPDYAPSADQIFACGPLPMYRDMAVKYGCLLKNKPTQVSLEVRMGCGLGICYSCTVKTRQGLKQACKDGPVFDFQDILWDSLVNIS